jgi:hypothetical protein
MEIKLPNWEGRRAKKLRVEAVQDARFVSMIIKGAPLIIQDPNLVKPKARGRTCMEEPGVVVLAKLAHPEGEALLPLDAQAIVLMGKVHANQVAEKPFRSRERAGFLNQVQKLNHTATVRDDLGGVATVMGPLFRSGTIPFEGTRETFSSTIPTPVLGAHPD